MDLNISRVHENWYWARLERPSTDSWMTICLGALEFSFEGTERHVKRFYPGWELVTYGQGCPDDELPQLLPDIGDLEDDDFV